MKEKEYKINESILIWQSKEFENIGRIRERERILKIIDKHNFFCCNYFADCVSPDIPSGNNQCDKEKIKQEIKKT